MDPFGELVNNISSCSALRVPRFLIHKSKTSLSLIIESSGISNLIDIRTLLYIITLIGAITSGRISICTSYNSVYLMDTGKKIFFKKSCNYLYNNTTKYLQICASLLLVLSIISPLFIYIVLNSQIILI